MAFYTNATRKTIVCVYTYLTTAERKKNKAEIHNNPTLSLHSEKNL